MADTDSVSRKEFEAYKAQIQDTVYKLAEEIQELKKEIGGLRSQIGAARAK